MKYFLLVLASALFGVRYPRRISAPTSVDQHGGYIIS